MGPREEIARAICDAAKNGASCVHCEGDCTLWPSFLGEADAALLVVKRWWRLDPRIRKKSKHPL